MKYGFNVEIAQKLGVNEAIIIRNFQHWLQKNKANNANFYDGRYWTYNSIAAFCKIFPFWTEYQIRNILKKLTACGILIKGNFNKNPYDKTIWYSIDDGVLASYLKCENSSDNVGKCSYEIQKEPESTETVDLLNLPNRYVENTKSMLQNYQIDMVNLPDRFGKNAKPIPCVNTNSKPCVNTHTQKSVCDEFSNEPKAGAPESINPDKQNKHTACNVTSNSLEVTEFCRDYKEFKNPEFEPSDEDKIEIAKVLSKNGGYDARKREYWCDVFKKAARGWKIVEKDLVRIAPCSLDKVLKEHSRIKANELGLLPPKKDAPKPELPLEPEIFEDAGDIEEAREKARALFNDLRRLNTPIR